MPSPTTMKREKESLEAENARLRARIKNLEHPTRDLTYHAFDAADRLARGFSYAAVEGLQSGVDALNAVADRVFARSPKAHYERTGNALSDASSGLAEGAHKVLETPSRVVDRFFEAFHEEPEEEPTEGEETVAEVETEIA